MEGLEFREGAEQRERNEDDESNYDNKEEKYRILLGPLYHPRRTHYLLANSRKPIIQ